VSGQIEQFLLTADVVEDRPAGKGVTHSRRLTLTDGTMTHDAHFQSIEMRRDIAHLANRAELKFADSYHFNIAAYRIAKLVGLDDMVPVTVERTWNGKPGAFSWWIDASWDEAARVEAGLRPPDVQKWGRQLNAMAVFSRLLYDTDRNHGNVLYTAAWDLWMIDFTRAFRPWAELVDPASLTQCDRELFARLQAWTADDLQRVAGDHLTAPEAEAVVRRRNLLVEHFQRLIDTKGEHRVLYGAGPG
jgi:hypothetical protein